MGKFPVCKGKLKNDSLEFDEDIVARDLFKLQKGSQESCLRPQIKKQFIPKSSSSEESNQKSSSGRKKRQNNLIGALLMTMTCPKGNLASYPKN